MVELSKQDIMDLGKKYIKLQAKLRQTEELVRIFHKGHKEASEQRDQALAQVKILQNPSDARCMDVHNLREHNKDLQKQVRDILSFVSKKINAPKENILNAMEREGYVHTVKTIRGNE
jgi:predicted KAP-like P-loop ATPase